MSCSCGAPEVCDVWGMFKEGDEDGLKSHFGPTFENSDILANWRNKRLALKKVDTSPNR